MKKLNIALVGLGFGAHFVPIYKAHPDVGELTLCEPNEARLRQCLDLIGGAVK